MPRSGQRGGEPVGGGRVERFGGERPFERCDGLGELTLLQLDLPEIDQAARIGRIHPQHRVEGRGSIAHLSVRPGCETNHVVRMWKRRQAACRIARRLQRFVGFPGVEERNSGVQLRDVQAWVQFERTLKRRHRFVVQVLLQQSHAQIVGAIRALTCILLRLPRWDRSDESDECQKKSAERAKHSS